MVAVDSIAECLDDSHRKRRKGAWLGEVIHRIKVPGHNDAASIARFDRNYPPLGKMAYAVIIHGNGLIEQALPFDRISPHAVGYNGTRVSVGCIGDFRTEPMPDAQRTSLVAVLAWCTARHRWQNFDGHTALDGASDDPEKVCPGDTLDIDALRRDVGVMRDAGDVPDLGFVLRS